MRKNKLLKLFLMLSLAGLLGFALISCEMLGGGGGDGNGDGDTYEGTIAITSHQTGATVSGTATISGNLYRRYQQSDSPGESGAGKQSCSFFRNMVI